MHARILVVARLMSQFHVAEPVDDEVAPGEDAPQQHEVVIDPRVTTLFSALEPPPTADRQWL